MAGSMQGADAAGRTSALLSLLALRRILAVLQPLLLLLLFRWRARRPSRPPPGKGQGSGRAEGARGLAHGLLAEAGPGPARGRHAARAGGWAGLRAHPHRLRRDAVHAVLVPACLLIHQAQGACCCHARVERSHSLLLCFYWPREYFGLIWQWHGLD
uniref:Uncharacterized protein n=1 Tax=Triticum urartu TaxID=4572 RepID=A0A8R7U2U5_TRIUA